MRSSTALIIAPSPDVSPHTIALAAWHPCRATQQPVDGSVAESPYRLANSDAPASPVVQPSPVGTHEEATPQAGQPLVPDAHSTDAPSDGTYLPGLSLRDRFSPEQADKKARL